MMWFFAVLVVLALGGVAAVAAGHGRPMAVEYDDRPDVTVPAGRPLAEDDVRRVRFSTALLGYRQSEVDALLDRLARELGEQARREAEAARREAEQEERLAAAVREATPEAGVGTHRADGATRPAAPAAARPAAARAPWWSRRRAGSPPRSE